MFDYRLKILREVIAAQASVVYQVYEPLTGKTEYFNTREDLLKHYHQKGLMTRPGVRIELQGQPILEGMNGPGWGGMKGDKAVARYESTIIKTATERVMKAWLQERS